MSGPDLKETLKEKYGQAALQVVQGRRASCGPTCSRENDPITSNLYTTNETEGLPSEAVTASLGY